MTMHKKLILIILLIPIIVCWYIAYLNYLNNVIAIQFFVTTSNDLNNIDMIKKDIQTIEDKDHFFRESPLIKIDCTSNSYFKCFKTIKIKLEQGKTRWFIPKAYAYNKKIDSCLNKIEKSIKPIYVFDIYGNYNESILNQNMVPKMTITKDNSGKYILLSNSSDNKLLLPEQLLLHALALCPEKNKITVASCKKKGTFKERINIIINERLIMALNFNAHNIKKRFLEIPVIKNEKHFSMLVEIDIDSKINTSKLLFDLESLKAQGITNVITY